MTEITLVEAITQALAYELEHDPDVVIMGEDIGHNGGVFRATDGLQAKFGENRVRDTPLAETMIAGLAVGMASQGIKPVAEFQFEGFIYPAIDQICNHAARMRNRTRGRLTCPAVFRAPWGGGIHAPEHHSDSPEAIFAHTPGLRVVIPSSPMRAYGLLLAAIRNPDPVVFFEPKRIYRAVKQPVPNNGEALPLDRAFVLREGSDVTIVTWGALVQDVLQLGQTLANEHGIEAEIIDVATVSHIDMETILNSVAKTGRCVITHEAPRNCGVGAEISAQLAEFGLDLLEAPVKRVTGYDTIMPYLKLEKAYLPEQNRILDAITECMEY